VELPARYPVPASAFRRIRRSTLLALLGLVALPVAAGAQTPSPTGGASPTTTPTAPATPTPTAAASAAPARPVVDTITCRTRCQGIARAKPGAVVRVSGEGMSAVTCVVFLGRKGSRDDVLVETTPVSSTAVDATLPKKAHTGPVRVITGTGLRSVSSSSRLVVRPMGSRDPGGPTVEAKALTRRFLFQGGRTATVSFYVRGTTPVDVAVDVVRASDRVAVAHFALPGETPGTVQSVD
jgi:hypothetical protein